MIVVAPHACNCEHANGLAAAIRSRYNTLVFPSHPVPLAQDAQLRSRCRHSGTHKQAKCTTPFRNTLDKVWNDSAIFMKTQMHGADWKLPEMQAVEAHNSMRLLGAMGHSSC